MRTLKRLLTQRNCDSGRNKLYPEGIEIIQPRVAAQPLPWV